MTPMIHFTPLDPDCQLIFLFPVRPALPPAPTGLLGVGGSGLGVGSQYGIDFTGSGLGSARRRVTVDSYSVYMFGPNTVGPYPPIF